MKIVALLYIYNESHVIRQCLEHLGQQGLHFYVTDNMSTDGTLDIVKSFEGRGLIGYDQYPRQDNFEFKQLLLHKDRLARTIDADWFIHHDADEFRTSNRKGESLADAIARIDQMGFNAINCQEFTFIPTEEHPVHYPETFLHTMKWYYAFLPRPLHRLNTWKSGQSSFDLISSGGHWVQFEGRKVYPESLHLRHYMYISKEHFLHKYQTRRHDPKELQMGWHGWREQADESNFYLAPEQLMKVFDFTKPWLLDADNPTQRHLVDLARNKRALKP